MEHEAVMQAATAAGLDKAVKAFPQDLIAAAAAAKAFRDGLGDSPAPSDEPWPPMRVATIP